MSQRPLRAAAGQVDLEPIVGSWLTGFAARPYPSDGQHDPLMARAVLLDDGVTKLAVVALDLIGMLPATAESIRQRIAAHSSISMDYILLTCSHTHSAPATMPFRGVLGYVNEKWWASVQAKIVDLVVGLERNLQPAQLSFAATDVEGVSYNRQDQARPIDTELIALAVDDVDDRPIATLMNFAMHPVTLGYANLKVSGDVPGEASRRLETMRGRVGLYLQGACGDVNPSIDLRRGWGNGTFDDVAEMSEQLAQAAARVLDGAPKTSDVHLNAARATVDLPLDSPPAIEELDALFAQFEADLRTARREARLVDEGIALAFLRWAAELKGAMMNGTLPMSQPVEIWAAAISELRLAAVPLEPFSDIALDFKRRIQPHKGLFVGYANGLIGYCATDWAKDQGGYGPYEACRWFPEQLTAIGYHAAEKVVEASVTLTQRLATSATIL